MRFIRMALVALATVTVVFAVSPSAKADILLEPYLGYTYGTFEQIPNGGGSQKWDNNNLNLGARVGWQFLVVMAGLDYQMPLSGKLKGQNGLTDYDLSGGTLYAFAGARLPLVRAYAGYALINDSTGSASGTSNTYHGDGLKFGVSFTGLPLIAINAEYITNDYKKVKTSTADQDISAFGYSKVTNNVIMLSVSAPLSF